MHRSDNNDQTPKPRKIGRGLFSCIKSTFTNNNGDPVEANNNIINSDINPTHRQERVKNYKGDSKTNSRSYDSNKDIKYQNNNKKKRKKVKPTTVQNKRNSSDKDSTYKEDNDRMPGLQDRNRPDSSRNDDDEYNRSDNENQLVTETDDKDNQLPYDITSTNSTITSERIDNNTNVNEYGGDSDKKEEEDEISRISPKQPIAPLQKGDGILQVEILVYNRKGRLS